MPPCPETTYQLAVLAESRAQFNEVILPKSVKWLFCKQTGDYSFDFYAGDLLISSLDLEKPRCDLGELLGIIVAGGIEYFETIRERWASRLPSLGICFQRVDQCEREELAGAAIECIAGRLLLQQRESGRAAIELATWRTEFDRLQRNFVRLEQYVGSHLHLRAVEIFEYPPDPMSAAGEEIFGNGDYAVSRSLIQYLPVDSFGLSSISIHFSAKPEGTASPLHIKLQAIETGKVFADWSIGAADTPAGWVDLALDVAIDEPALSVEIVVDWPDGANGWVLTLGPPHPFEEFRARALKGRSLGAPIAVRVFAGLPGARVPAVSTAIKPVNARRILTESFPYETYGAVGQVIPPSEDEGSALVSYDGSLGCITVHPRKGGLKTVARMNVDIPKHAWRISAQVHLAHERSSVTQFALMIGGPRDGVAELERLDQLEAPGLSFSGWRSVGPLERKSISVLIAAPGRERISLYLVTRQAPDASADFAWARFDRFQFNILPESLIRQSDAGGMDLLRPAPALDKAAVTNGLEMENEALGTVPNAKYV